MSSNKPFGYFHILLLLLCISATLVSQSHGEEAEEVPLSLTKGKCVMYGSCRRQEGIDSICKVDHPPRKVSTEALRQLQAVCPEIVEQHGNELCCSANQIEFLVQNLEMQQTILGRCPSCFHNFRQTFCNLVCTPEQYKFINSTETRPSLDVDEYGQPKQAVTKVNYLISKKSVQETFDSCKNVLVSFTNRPALDILCGPWGSYHCTPERWFDYLGSSTNGFSPFDLIFHYVQPKEGLKDYQVLPLLLDLLLPKPEPTTHEPFIYETYRCSDNPPNSNRTCSCSDCPLNCPAAPELPYTSDNDDTVVAGVFGGYLIIEFLLVFLVIVIIVSFVLKTKCTRESENDKQQNTQSFNSEVPFFMNYIPWFFSAVAEQCATTPYIILGLGVLVITGLCSGLIFFRMSSDTVEQWTDPNSRARMERDFFVSTFGPQYRREQVILTAKHLPSIMHKTPDGMEEFGPIFNKEFMYAVLDLQKKINEIEIGGTTLNKICHKPLYPDNKNCTILSYLGYWQNSMQEIELEVNFIELSHLMTDTGIKDNYLDHFKYCSKHHNFPMDSTSSHQSCFGAHGGPIDPRIVLGGYPNDGDVMDGTSYRKANTAVITYLVDNSQNQDELSATLAWEKQFLAFMKKYIETQKPVFIDVAYSAQRSLEDEILQNDKTSKLVCVVVGYFLMFLYVAFSLADFTTFARIMVDAQITIGIAGALMTFMSVVCSVGFFSFFGMETNIIAIEVFPFIVLAVGLDNMIIMIQHCQNLPKENDESTAKHLGRAVGEIAPTLLLNSLSAVVAFALAGLTGISAVRTFAFFTGAAVLLNTVLQFTCLISIISLDVSRREENRFDLLCCFKGAPPKGKVNPGCIHATFQSFLAPLLTKFPVRVGVLIFFFAWFCSSLAIIPSIDVGMEPTLPIPKDSYISKFFDVSTDSVPVGHPLYLVLNSSTFNYADEHNQNLIRGGDNPHSLVSQIFSASRVSNRTYVAKPSNSWIDDYIDWASNENCCRWSIQDPGFCPSSIVDSKLCKPCELHEDVTLNNGRIPYEKFDRYISWFLQDSPFNECPKGGRAFADSVTFVKSYGGRPLRIGSSHFQTYHTALTTSQDHLNAMAEARTLAANITKMLQKGTNSTSHQVFAYSSFYVFYEQYLHIWGDTLKLLGITLATVITVTFILTGFDIYSSLIITLTTIMIVINVGGFMRLSGVPLNAISLVNLVMILGIATEFSAMIVHAFTISRKASRVERSSESLVSKGHSVLLGVTFTKVVGLVILAFAQSQLVRVFFFRVYLALLIFGAAHALVFLPCLLSFIGPPVRHRSTSV